MTSEKFISEVKTLKKFYELYCIDKHQNQYNKSEIQIYKDLKIDIDLYLCKDARHMADAGDGKADDPRRDAAGGHEAGGQHKKRNRQKREMADKGVHQRLGDSI